MENKPEKQPFPTSALAIKTPGESHSTFESEQDRIQKHQQKSAKIQT
jgi:hypothetical protein